MRRIYLDYNATTPIAPAVREVMLPFLAEQFGNPSSGHAFGAAAHEAIDDARLRVAALLGASPDEVVFTSGGTESNNLAIKGVCLRPGRPLGHIVISAIEHPAVVEPVRYLERLGARVTVVPCDGRGLVDPRTVLAALRDDTQLVSIMLANNEIGVIQPIADIARGCHENGVLVHTDATQAVGKIPVRVVELDVDLLTVAGHKCYAPKGVGALYVRRGVEFEPLLHGAGHEGGRRAGTENTAFIVGLGRAATLAAAELSDSSARLSRLTEKLSHLLRRVIGERFSVNGAGAPRLPNTLSVNFPDVVGRELLDRVPELCASTGSACHDGRMHCSPTLAALGIPESAARGTVRLSLGWYTTDDELERAASLLIGSWEALTRK